jgi:hypothetical protein
MALVARRNLVSWMRLGLFAKQARAPLPARPAPLLGASGLALAALILLVPAASRADGWGGRSVSASAGGGYRIWSRQLGLENDAALSLRLGLSVTERLAVSLDYVLSAPIRKATQQSASVSALRALVRYDVWRGPVRPYLIAGAGGFLANFDDSNDFSTGALTFGAGVERPLGGGSFLAVEASTDLYRSEVVHYDMGGAVLSRSPRTTNALGTLGVSLGTRF